MGTNCPNCGAQIFHAFESSTGKRVPVDVSPHPAGTLLVDMSGTVPACELLAGETRQRAVDRGAELHMSHFYTCGGDS